jgi:hypothetical protein
MSKSSFRERTRSLLSDEEQTKWWETINSTDGGFRLAELLSAKFTPRTVSELAEPESPHKLWEDLGNIYLKSNRHFEAIAVYSQLYQHFIEHERTNKCSVHKRMPLIWISDCYRQLRCPVLAKRYLMYTLCEDAIRGCGVNDLRRSGVYHRALWQHGMSVGMLTELAGEARQRAGEVEDEKRFPERILMEISDQWMSESPFTIELNRYIAISPILSTSSTFARNSANRKASRSNTLPNTSSR